MTTDTNKLNIAIVGGGIGGLCLAAGLLAHPHLDVHVYESVPEYKDIGAGLALHMNAIQAMALIGPHVKKAYFDKALTMAEEADQEMSTVVSLAAGPSKGAVVAELGKAKGRKTVARSDLLAGLQELIPSDRLHFDKRLSRIAEHPDDTVTLTFRDGTTTTTACLLGADGVHSHVRAHLLGPDHPATKPKNHDGWQIYRTLVPRSLAAEHIPAHLLTTVPILCGPRGHINIMPLHHGRDISAGVAVRGALLQPDPPSPPPALDPSSFSDYTADARSVVSLVARDTSSSWTATDHDPAPFYSRRRICITGDAAHAAYPFAGQGAAQAIEDAAVLTALFGRPDLVLEPGGPEAALKAYDEVRRPRSQTVVRIAREFGSLYAFADPEVRGAGDEDEDVDAMRRKMARLAAYSNGADLVEQNARAVRRFEQILEEGRAHGASGEVVGYDGEREREGEGDREWERKGERTDEGLGLNGKADPVREVVGEQVQAVAG